MINWSDFPSDSLLHLPASTRPSSVHISHISTRFPHLMIYVLMSQSIIFAFQSEYPLFPSLRWPKRRRKKIDSFSRAQVSLRSGLPCLFCFFISMFFFVVFQFLTMVLPNILISPKIWRVFVWRIGSPSFSTLIYNIINNYHHHLMIIII